MWRSTMEKVDIAQQHGKTRYGAVKWKSRHCAQLGGKRRLAWRSSVEKVDMAQHLGKVDIVQHFGKSRYHATAWKRRQCIKVWKR